MRSLIIVFAGCTCQTCDQKFHNLTIHIFLALKPDLFVYLPFSISTYILILIGASDYCKSNKKKKKKKKKTKKTPPPKRQQNKMGIHKLNVYKNKRANHKTSEVKEMIIRRISIPGYTICKALPLPVPPPHTISFTTRSADAVSQDHIQLTNKIETALNECLLPPVC